MNGGDCALFVERVHIRVGRWGCSLSIKEFFHSWWRFHKFEITTSFRVCAVADNLTVRLFQMTLSSRALHCKTILSVVVLTFWQLDDSSARITRHGECQWATLLFFAWRNAFRYSSEKNRAMKLSPAVHTGGKYTLHFRANVICFYCVSLRIAANLSSYLSSQALNLFKFILYISVRLAVKLNRLDENRLSIFLLYEARGYRLLEINIWKAKCKLNNYFFAAEYFSVCSLILGAN